ncbi:MAG: YHS domain-containing protein [Candidatus Omnitrophota bacterium]|nr:YHS domain-containing protein [Candidatus Omnitrophota bacterium]
MDKRIAAVLIAVIFTVGIVINSFAMCGMCEKGAKSRGVAASGAEKVNNKVCPITGSKVDMKNPVTYEHEGKVYNFCCPMCIDEFKKDPKKYIEKIAKEEAPSAASSHEAHSGHSH